MIFNGRRVKFWTDEEIGFLEDNPHMPQREIAEILDRPVRAIEGKRRHLRKSCESTRRVYQPWTEEDDAFIRFSSHLTASQASEQMGRSANAISIRRSQLGVDCGNGSHKNPMEVGARRLLAKTCLDCGLLLEATWFGFNSHSRSWRPSCGRCRPSPQARPRTKKEAARVARESSARLQAASLPTATNHRNSWVEKDHEVLADPDLTRFEKAVRLGRTYLAVVHQCTSNGYDSRRGRGDPIKGQWIIDNPNAPKVEAAA